MTRPRQPRPHDPLERQIAAAKALLHRHDRWRTLARLGREVERLDDPSLPGPAERRIRALLDETAR